MNNYESFKPIDRSVGKSGGTLFKRVMAKINKSEKPLNPVGNMSSPKMDKKVVGGVKDSKLSDKESTPSANAYRRPSNYNLKSTRYDNELVFDETITISKLLGRIKSNVSTTVAGNTDNLPMKHKLNRIYWMPDSICNNCYFCEDEFTAIRRRHHCRMCGQIFCYRCCAFELPGSLWNHSKPQRSCHRCFQSFYATNSKRRLSNLSTQNLSNHDTASSSGHNHSHNSPTFSQRSENVLTTDQHLDLYNRNLSFSSNDVSTNGLYNFTEPQLKPSNINEDYDTMKRNNSVPEFVVTSNDPVEDTKIEHKVLPTMLNPLTYIPFFNNKKSITASKSILQSSTPEPVWSSRKIQKEILLLVWKEIIDETNRLRVNYFNKIKIQNQIRRIEGQFSFPNDEDSLALDSLNIIFTNTTASKSCIHGSSLVNWIFNKIDEVKDKSHSVAICQSYLEMQLISPYFQQENYKQFKDDNTMYVIREVSSEYSPRSGNKDYDGSHFTNYELMGYLSNNNFQKSCGNSTFYADEDPIREESKQQDSEKLAFPHTSHFDHLNNREILNEVTDTCCNISHTNLWSKSCEYLEKLLKQELRDYNLDISWCNIILPICKLISETVSPNISDAKWTNDIKNYIQIKKIPDSPIPDCKVIYSISMSKNVDFPVMKDLKNPSVILIRSSIDYWRHKKLVSLEPLLLQEEEYLKNCVRKIINLKPDIVVVEGNVSSIAREIIEISGLVLVSNVRKTQMDRLARMLGTVIFDSVDSLGANVETPLGRCSQFSVARFILSNGRHKNLLFFKLFNHKYGCTLLLHSQSLSELVRLKYITRFMIMAFRNAYLELACLKNFQIRFMGFKSGTVPKMLSAGSSGDDQAQDTSLTFLDIIETRIIALSPNVHYLPPTSVLRQLRNPELQGRLLSLDILNISWKEKLHNVLKRKQRHICAEFYDDLRMKTRKHPLLRDPGDHSFLNCFHDRQLNNNSRCILYSDFRANGSRFHKVNENIDDSLVSSRNFDSSDLVVYGGFLTREQETRWRELEKKKFESIWESFNPRNYRRILLLYSVQTPIGICEKPRKISLGYYESSDKTLGNFVSSMLNETANCPIKCDISLYEHVYKFVHNGGCIEVSVHQMESDSHRKCLNTIIAEDNNPGGSSIKVWNWCSRCDKLLSLRDMTEETWNLSLGRFFDLLFNINSLDANLAPGQCSHSLQNDVQYYFTQSSTSRALEIKYVSVVVYEFQTPDIFMSININNKSSDDLIKCFKDLQKEIENVTEIKTKYNIEIKDKIMKLKADSKVEDSDLWDFLKQESNTDQYSISMENIYNLMEQIYHSSTDTFNVELFKRHEHMFKSEIIQKWIDVVDFVRKWDQKLHEALEREEKEKKLIKVDTKNAKSSQEDLLMDSDIILSKSFNNPTLILDVGLKENSLKKMISYNYDTSHESVDGRKKYLWTSCEDRNVILPGSHLIESRDASRPISRTSTSENFENITESEQMIIKKEKAFNLKVTDNDAKQITPSDRPSGSTASAFSRKFFPSFFNSNNLKVLEECTPLECSYVFPDIWSVMDPVVVKDDSITSIISFALSSNIYQDKLNEMIQYSVSRPSVKSESSAPLDGKMSSDIGQIDGFNNPNTFNNEGSGLYKDRSGSTLVESTLKDRDICVRYLNRPEADDPAEMDNVEMYNNDIKLENEDVKIEISNDDNFSDDTCQRPIANTKIPTTAPKKVPKCDFEITFNNHKAKCFCRIYNALQFHKLRDEILGNDQQSYIRSLNDCKHWVTTGGKSGLKFRKTMDDRYVIKQLHPMELNGFKKFYEKYFDYVMGRVTKKQKCVLAKILGVYHVDYTNSSTKISEKLDFLVMENLFYNQKPSKIFDLKGNKHITVNVTSEKMTASDACVMQDKDFISYTRTKPIYVSWHTQLALKDTLTRDTDFLRGLPVMDYSLLVGVDDSNQVLVIGIIDYLRMFTIDKLIEMHFKQKLLTPHGESPTVIQPQRYQKRFLQAIEEYFLICPVPWDCLLLCPTMANVNNNESATLPIDGQQKLRKEKTTIFQSSFEKTVDENKLRLGLFESI